MFKALLTRNNPRVTLDCLKSVSQFHTSSVSRRVTGLPKGLYSFQESQADFEASTAEWNHVERLLPTKLIPKPKAAPGEVMPSGWVAPSAKRDDHPYFVNRDRNHLLKVYKYNNMVHLKMRTYVKSIEGDIFALGKELKEHLTLVCQRRSVSVRVHEPHGVLIIKGDFVEPVTKFLYEKGF